MNLFAESTGGSFLLNHDNPQSETISYYVSTYTSIVIFLEIVQTNWTVMLKAEYFVYLNIIFFWLEQHIDSLNI